MSLAGRDPQSEAPEDRKHRSKQVLRLLLLLQHSRKMPILKSGPGSILTEEEETAQKLCRFWGGSHDPHFSSL